MSAVATPRSTRHAPRPHVLVTGSSSGIGRATALTLARHGLRVFATVRRAEDAEALQVAAGAVGVGNTVRPVLLDVTDPAGIAEAAELVRRELAERGGALVGLVNNAGIVVGGPVEEVPLERLREVLEVNVVGVVAVTQAFLPLLRAGRGRIVNVSSVSGRVAAPFLGAYAASKFALEALSDALRVELRPWGLRMVLVEPGPVATPFWDKGHAEYDERESGEERAGSPYARYAPALRARFRESEAGGLPAEAVAQAIHRALVVPRPRARYLVTRRPLLFALFSRLAPDGVRDAWLGQWVRPPRRAGGAGGGAGARS